MKQPPGPRAAYGVGIIHGIGSETPTQLGLFVLSARCRQLSSGLPCVLTFAAGLLAMSTLLAVASAGMFHLSNLREPIYRSVMILTGTYSIRSRGAVHPGWGGVSNSYLTFLVSCTYRQSRKETPARPRRVETML